MEKVTDKITDVIDEDDLEMISNSMYIPYVNDKVDSAIGWVTHDKTDIEVEDIQEYLNNIAQ